MHSAGSIVEELKTEAITDILNVGDAFFASTYDGKKYVTFRKHCSFSNSWREIGIKVVARANK